LLVHGTASTTTSVFQGDGVTTFFPISNLITTVPFNIIVNLQGIQQVAGTDYIVIATGTTGIQFIVPPESGSVINVYVLWSAIGSRPTAIVQPTTIQWDWAFWDYADLGVEEFDMAGVMIGDGVTENFTLGIPQTSTTLYNTQLQIYSNGILTTAAAMGLTVQIIPLATTVTIAFSAPLPLNAYAALYISRGLYEGLQPTFGYQDPSGIVLTPTPSSYQHFFARLITPTFDPSTMMSGCPTPDERVQTLANDIFTLVVKTYPLTFEPPPFITLTGVSATTAVGHLTLTGSTPGIIAHLSGVTAISQHGNLTTKAQHLQGQFATSAHGSLGITVHPHFLGNVATSNVGALHTSITHTLPGAATTSAISHFGYRISYGQQAKAQVGTFPVSKPLHGVAAVSTTGQLVPNPKRVNPSGVAATSGVGTMAISVT
jgi:hypothetical protein